MRASPAAGPLHAVGFLTRLPVRLPDAPPDLRAAVPWFPVVGALVGAIGAGILALAALVPGAGAAGVAAALGLAATVAVTGALHEDGLADVADGLGVLGDRERRLAVMRDPRTGSFGVLALLVWGLVSWSALRALPTDDAVRALVAAAALGRGAILVHVAATRPARPDGAIHALVLTPVGAAAAAAACVAAALLLLGVGGGAIALGVAALSAGATSGLARRAIGGATGDTCGATAAIAQAAVLVVALGVAA